jgi:hypothetical protein
MAKLKRTFMIALLTFTFAASLFAQTPNNFERTATSSIEASRDKEGNTLITTINRRFKLIDFPTQPLPTPLLLLEEFKSEHRLGIEGQNSVVRVDAWLGIQPSKKIWSIEQNGDEGAVFDEFYKITKHGCCASIATDFYFNLETGQKVFSSTKGLFTVIVPNTSFYRYISYHSNDAVIPPIEPRNDALVGVIQYGTDKKVILKLAVRSKIQAAERIKFQYQNKLSESNSLMLWGVDGKDDKSSLSDFAIVISYGSAGDIILPVTNDNIDLSRAVFPAKFSLEIVK